MKTGFLKFIVLAIALASGITQTVNAEEEWKNKIPKPLAEWAPWVMRDIKVQNCPRAYNDSNVKNCTWNKEIEVDFYNDLNAKFKISASLNDDGFLKLPGNKASWPTAVQSGSEKLAVVEKEGVPVVWLKPGNYSITGSFKWVKSPTELKIPADTAIVKLVAGGKVISNPEFTQRGALILSKKEKVSESISDNLDVKVFRKLTDTQPTVLETRVRLNVSGKIREIDFDYLQPDGFQISEIKSDLPIALKDDNKLTVQIKPGNWQVTLFAFSLKPVSEITMPATASNWSEQELWAFQSAPDLRVVDLSANLIDPNQTDLPAEWKNFNVFLLDPTSKVTLTETARGDTSSRRNDLTLTRDMKLNFDGTGYNITDLISGQISTEGRLEMNPAFKLGAVSISGVDQVINKVNETSNPGVELRNGSYNFAAEARYKNDISVMPVHGWNQDFKRIDTTLTLPPGWRVFHVSGADSAFPTWINTWSLLEVFMMMLCAVIIFKVFGKLEGVIALIGLALMHLHLDVKSELLTLLLLVALGRVLEEGSFLKYTIRIKTLVLLFFAFTAIPFIISDIRSGIYPQLKHSYNTDPQEAYDTASVAPAPQVMRATKKMPLVGGVARSVQEGVEDLASSIPQGEPLNRYSSNNFAQTGFGKTNWSSYETVSLNWNGTVTESEMFSIYYVRPYMNLILSFLRASFILFIFYCVGMDYKRKKIVLENGSVASAAGLIFALLALFNQQNAYAQELPDGAMLQDLKNFVSSEIDKEPDCKNECAVIEKLVLTASADSLELDYQINAAANVYVPLAVNRSDFAISEILSNGTEAQFYLSDSSIYVSVKSGINNIKVKARPSSKDTLTFNFTLVPKSLEFSSADWEILGLNDGVPAQTVQLNRIRQAIQTDGKKDEPEISKEIALTPMIVVKRDITLALEAEVRTTVQKLSRTNSVLKIKLPLINGESVTSGGISVQDGFVMVELKPSDSAVSFTSKLELSPKLSLKHQETDNWHENWSLAASSDWHVEYEGTPRIYSPQIEADKFYWSPRRSEELTLSITKLSPSSGATKTIQMVNLESTPAERKTDYVMRFEIKSSKGEDHVIQIPADSMLESLTINQAKQSVKLDNGKLTLKLNPGLQQVDVRWNEPTGIKANFQTSKIDLGLPAVNFYSTVSVPLSRWILCVKRSVMSPVVLFWGLLPAILIFSFGLGRVKGLPLKTYQWVLLFTGLSMVNIYLNILIVGWFIIMHLRSDQIFGESRFFAKLKQIFLFLFSLFAFSSLFGAIREGLLGQPDMMIEGNNSYDHLLRWYFDITTATLPQVSVFTLPMLYYRIAMLLWASWLAFSLIRWGKWGWDAFSANGYWPAKKHKVEKVVVNNEPKQQ